MAVTIDVIKQISKKTGVPTYKSRAYLKALTDSITSGIRDGKVVDIQPLGKFQLIQLPEREVTAKLGGKQQDIDLEPTVVPNFQPYPAPNQAVKPAPVKTDNSSSIFRVGTLRNTESNVQFIELNGKTIPKPILSLIPEPIARKYKSVPFLLEDKTLSVAMTDPENEEAFNAIRKITGKIVKPFITTDEDMSYALDQYSALQSEMKEMLASDDTEEITPVEEKDQQTRDEDADEASPAAKVISTLLKRAVREKASDIHIEPSEEAVLVRFRVDGVLRKVLTLPKEIQSSLISRIKILSNLKIDETRLPQDGRIQVLMDGNNVDFRISTIPTVTGEKVVARVLDHSKGTLTFEQLGLRGRALQILEDNTKKAHGMTLVTGPTGSGKSTTLYAIISKIKGDGINIITMEDPVEYRMTGVNQSQVNSKIGYTFANGLRSILRQDPDVIMVGEIRDKETADIAINAALTGHIVVSSLHTNDAAGAIPRLLDMGIEPFLITSSTNAVIAQRLCRQICDKCRKEITLKDEETALLAKDLDALPEPEKTQAKQNFKFYQGEGCSACGNTGYKGRIGIFEILGVTEPIKQLALKRATSSDIFAEAQKEGFITMRQDGLLKVFDGLTTLEEVWRVTKD